MPEGFYEIITDHLDAIDKKIEELEERVGVRAEVLIDEEDTLLNLTFNQIGYTGDENSYPILIGKDSGHTGTIVAVPVDNYEEVTKHLDEVDKEIEELKKRVRPSVDELVNNIVPRPFKFCNAIVFKDENGGLNKVQSETQDEKYRWADELQPSVLSDEELDVVIAYDTYLQAADIVRNR